MTALKDSEDKARRKPVFGPPMTPENFESKWLEKFLSIKSRYEIHDVPKTSAEKLSVIDNLVQAALAAVPNIHFCYREEKALGVCLPEIEQIKAEPLRMRCALVSALSHHLDVQSKVAHMRNMKNGRQRPGQIRWQDLPLQIRRDINKLLEMVRVEEDKGYWTVSEKVRELYDFVQDWITQSMVGKNAFGATKRLKVKDWEDLV